MPAEWLSRKLRSGIVIPAHPLALDRHRQFDEHRQRALTRYFLDAGAGGIAVGVHTTQFEIRNPEHGLFEPVLRAASEIVAEEDAGFTDHVLIAGVAGRTEQAVAEASLARDLGYHAVLLSMSAMRQASLEELIRHTDAVAREMPVIGFYLQPAVGGMRLPVEFWRRFVAIPNVVAIKIAPFNRYATIDVVRSVADAGRGDEIALYTGNDDNIVADLVTSFDVGQSPGRQRVVGGLLGQWACWTSKAVTLLRQCHHSAESDSIPSDLLRTGTQLTLANAAIFDVAHNYRGSIAGVNEVLRRQGLLATSLCLDPHNDLSPGQSALIDEVSRRFPELADDDFVREHRDRWLTL